MESVRNNQEDGSAIIQTTALPGAKDTNGQDISGQTSIANLSPSGHTTFAQHFNANRCLIEVLNYSVGLDGNDHIVCSTEYDGQGNGHSHRVFATTFDVNTGAVLTETSFDENGSVTDHFALDGTWTGATESNLDDLGRIIATVTFDTTDNPVSQTANYVYDSVTGQLKSYDNFDADGNYLSTTRLS